MGQYRAGSLKLSSRSRHLPSPISPLSRCLFADATKNSLQECQEVQEALLKRLEKDQPDVRFKVQSRDCARRG